MISYKYLLYFSHSESESTVALASICINILLQRLNFGLILCRRSKRNKFFISTLSEYKGLAIDYSLDNDTHHFAVRGKFINLKYLIFFDLAINLNLNAFGIFGNNIDNARGLPSLQKLDFILRGSGEGGLGGAWKVDLQDVVADSYASPQIQIVLIS